MVSTHHGADFSFLFYSCRVLCRHALGGSADRSHFLGHTQLRSHRQRHQHTVMCRAKPDAGHALPQQPQDSHSMSPDQRRHILAGCVVDQEHLQGSEVLQIGSTTGRQSAQTQPAASDTHGFHATLHHSSCSSVHSPLACGCLSQQQRPCESQGTCASRRQVLRYRSSGLAQHWTGCYCQLWSPSKQHGSSAERQNRRGFARQAGSGQMLLHLLGQPQHRHRRSDQTLRTCCSTARQMYCARQANKFSVAQ